MWGTCPGEPRSVARPHSCLLRWPRPSTSLGSLDTEFSSPSPGMGPTPGYHLAGWGLGKSGPGAERAACGHLPGRGIGFSPTLGGSRRKVTNGWHTGSEEQTRGGHRGTRGHG